MADLESVEPDAPIQRGAGRTVAVAVVVVLVLLGGIVAVVALRDDAPAVPVGGATGPPGLTAEEPPEELPPATLAGFADGEAVDLERYRGHPLIVNFWATWCAPCVNEMPDLQRFAAAAGDDLTVLGIDLQDAPPNAEAFVEELGITYDLATDPRGEYYAAVNAFGMPTTLFVTSDGAIAQRHTGELTYDEFVELADELLGVRIAG